MWPGEDRIMVFCISQNSRPQRTLQPYSNSSHWAWIANPSIKTGTFYSVSKDLPRVAFTAHLCYVCMHYCSLLLCVHTLLLSHAESERFTKALEQWEVTFQQVTLHTHTRMPTAPFTEYLSPGIKFNRGWNLVLGISALEAIFPSEGMSMSTVREGTMQQAWTF